MQPPLAVQYNSVGGNGWMGMGWDIPAQAITIDTRFGVPRYDAASETETYLLNGEQLTPVAHRGEPVERARPKRFPHTRRGPVPPHRPPRRESSTYWWEVHRQERHEVLLRRRPDTNAPTANSTLTDAAGNVYLWSLREMRDPNNNFIKYHCVRVSDPGVAGGTVPGVNLYLQRVT